MGLKCRNTRILFGSKLPEGLNKRAEGWKIQQKGISTGVGINGKRGSFLFVLISNGVKFTKNPRAQCERVINRSV